MARKRAAPRKQRNNQSKKARVSDPAEDEQPSIYFLVEEQISRKQHWYVTNLNSAKGGKQIDVGRGTGPCAVKLDMQYPVKGARCVTFGSYRTLIYGLGGLVFGDHYGCGSSVLRSIYFYDPANPTKGWLRGPDMIATRVEPCHRVVDDKLYVLGGISLSEEEWGRPCSYPWGECLDLRPYLNYILYLQRRPEWHPLDFPLSPRSCEENPSAFEVPVFRGKFDPHRHLLVGIGFPLPMTVCYDVRRKLFRRVSDVGGILSQVQAYKLLVDGDYVFAQSANHLLAVGAFGNRSPPPLAPPNPWFVGYVEGMLYTCGRLPHPRYCSDEEDAADFPEDPNAFSLVRIAPFKYAALWSPHVISYDSCYDGEKKEKSCVVRLSVFTVSPASPPIMDEKYDLPLLPATIDVSDEHLPLGLQANVDVLAAVAVCPSCLPKGDVLAKVGVNEGTSSVDLGMIENDCWCMSECVDMPSHL